MTYAFRRLPLLALAAASLSGCGMYRSYGSHDSTALTLAAYETAVQEADAAGQRAKADWAALQQAAQGNPALAPVLAQYAHAMGQQDSLLKVHAAHLDAIKNPSLFKRIVGIGGYQYRKANEAYGALATEQAILNDHLVRLGATLAGRPTTTTYLDGMVEDSRFYWMPPFYHKLIAATEQTDLVASARTFRAPASVPVAAPLAPVDSASALVPMPAPADTAHAAPHAHGAAH